jgi:hypothetical protein
LPVDQAGAGGAFDRRLAADPPIQGGTASPFNALATLWKAEGRRQKAEGKKQKAKRHLPAAT